MPHKHLTYEQKEEIKYLVATGLSQVEIAEKYGISKASVSLINKYGHTARRRKDKEPYVYKTPDAVFEELDFSQFPDTVIFKHDRTFIF